jgi:hypothetical protein
MVLHAEGGAPYVAYLEQKCPGWGGRQDGNSHFKVWCQWSRNQTARCAKLARIKNFALRANAHPHMAKIIALNPAAVFDLIGRV